MRSRGGYIGRGFHQNLGEMLSKEVHKVLETQVPGVEIVRRF